MKLPLVLLAAISAVVAVSSCTKSVDTMPPDTNPVDTANDGGNQHPHYCPACGLG